MRNNREYEIIITLPRKKPFKNAFQFRITLLGTKPPVWRRIVVPESYTFYDFHVAIQDAMGWQDKHLHLFEIEDKGQKGKSIRIDCPFGEPEFLESESGDYFLTTEVPLKKFFNAENQKALYYYDFGDGWIHEVTLEKICPKEPRRSYPLCLDGDLACPPEDCGGIVGYYDCVKAFKNQNNTDGLLDWLGDWNPFDFNPEKVVFENPRDRLRQAFGE